jgi:hypothetical protein
MKSTVMDDELLKRQVTALEHIAEHLESLVCETELCRGALEVFTREARREENDIARRHRAVGGVT